MAVGTPTTNQGNSATPSVAVPAGVASGDIVVLICEFDDSGLALAARWPAGFTGLKDAQGTGDGARYGIAWKRLSAGDTGSYTLASGTATLYLMAAIPLTGRHATNAPTISADSIQNTLQNSPATITALTVTAVAGDDVLFISMPDVHTANGGNGHSGWTAGYTEIVDAEDTTSGFCNIGVAKAENVSAGATGSKTTTFTTAAGQTGWGAWLLTIPAAAGGTSATVTAVVAASAGSAPVAALSAGATVTAAVADSVGSAPVAAVSAGGGVTVSAVPAVSIGSAPVAALSAGATVSAAPAVSAGTAPPANQLVSAVLNAPAVISLGSAPVASVSTSGADATISAVPAVSAGSVPVVAIATGSTVAAVVADSAGSAPAAALSAGVAVGAVPALSSGQVPRAATSPPPPSTGVSGDIAATFSEAST